MFRICALAVLTVVIQSRAQTPHDLVQLAGEWNGELFEYCLAAARADGDSSKVIIIKSIEGKHYASQRDYHRAEHTLRYAYGLMSEGYFRKRNFDYLTVYDVLDHLGRLYAETGSFSKADAFFRQGFETKSRRFRRGTTTRILNTLYLSEYYIAQQQDSMAQVYLRQLLDQLDHSRHANRVIQEGYDVYYRGMTRLALRKGDPASARKYLEKAYEVHDVAGHHFRKAKKWEGDAELLLLWAEYHMAVSDWNGALDVAARIDSRDRIQVLPQISRIKIRCYVHLNRFDNAISEARALLEQDEKNISELFGQLTEDEKESFAATIENDINLLFSLAAEVASRGGGIPAADLLSIRMKTKGLRLSHALALKRAIGRSTDPEIAAMTRQLNAFKSKASQQQMTSTPLPLELARIKDSIDLLERNIFARIESIERKSPENPVAQLQEKLQNSLAVEMVRYQQVLTSESPTPTNYLALIVTPDSISFFQFPNGSGMETRYAEGYRKYMERQINSLVLYDAFWSPLEPFLKGAGMVYFSGDGVYNKINVNTLFDGEKYVIDKFNIATVSNLADLISDLPRAGPQTASFIARPDFTGEPLVLPDAAREKAATRRLMTIETIGTGTYRDLPFTETEAKQAAAILLQKGWSIQEFYGSAATEKTLKAIINPGVLHVATHGFFAENTSSISPLLESGLILAGANTATADRDDDGILTAYEAAALQLDSTALVVLSACETGLGDIRNGEGVFGLPRAFMLAGARQIILSLWSVDDQATQQLMVSFYKKVADGLPVREAFLDAQRELRTVYPSAYYWGAFIVVGI